MLKRLRLKNVYSHKDSTLEFVEGVNIIVGETDSGKSAILRSLRLLQQNRPLGVAFHSWWGGNSEIELTTSEDVAVRRVDGTDKYYQIGEGEPMRAFGTGVPEEVKEVIGLDDVNFQWQLDSPFLLTSTSGEVAQHFNRIAKLDKFDKGQTNLKKWLNQHSSTLEKKKVELKQKQEQLQQFSTLPEIEQELEVLEGNVQSAKNKKALIEKLNSLISGIEEVTTSIVKQTRITSIELYLTTLISKISEQKEQVAQYTKLEKIIAQVEANEAERQKLKTITSLAEKISELSKKWEEMDTKAKEEEHFSWLIERITKTEQELVMIKKQHEEYHKKLEAEIGEVCPLCETELKKR